MPCNVDSQRSSNSAEDRLIHPPEWYTGYTHKVQQDHHSSTLYGMFDSRVRSTADVMDVNTVPNAVA
jgi:hypothetical protein